MKERTYICCDLKSFYASVECIERGLNPLDTNLVVADLSRTEKTICLAVTPSLKSYGISGRARLFEVIQRVKEVNAQRQRNTPGRQFTSASSHDPEVRRNPSLALDYIVAPPRMAHYIDWSTRVYSVYLKHVAPEDIYPYSIDEVFIDATSYLQTYHLSAREFARKIILDILQTTGITAAAGIGTNLYLAKVAMDIGAKHVPADEYGVRIAELDEMGYRRSFWTHRPLTDFWRVGKGYAAKLEANGLYTMGDIARCSIGQPTDYPRLRADLSLYKTPYPDFPIPRLVFGFSVGAADGAVSACRIGVIADETPTPDTIMYRYPFSNVDSSGSLCIGTNTLPQYKELRKAAGLPALLLSIPNNFDRFDPSDNQLGLEYRDLMQHLKDKEPAYYYTDILIPNGQKLAHFIQRM